MERCCFFIHVVAYWLLYVKITGYHHYLFMLRRLCFLTCIVVWPILLHDIMTMIDLINWSCMDPPLLFLRLYFQTNIFSNGKQASYYFAESFFWKTFLLSIQFAERSSRTDWIYRLFIFHVFWIHMFFKRNIR